MHGSVTETAPKIKVGVFLSLAGVLIVLKVSSNIWVQLHAWSLNCNSQAFGFSLKYLNVFSIDYINLQLAFSCGLVNPESAILYHKVLQKVWEDEEFLLLEK